jgi:predicted secreted protein
MASKARTALGVVLSISATGETFVPIAEIQSVKQSGRKAETEDVTSFDSTRREYITTIADDGEFDLAGIYVPGDVGQVALEAAFTAATAKDFKVVLPKTSAQTVTGDTITFTAVITELNNLDLDPTKAMKFSSKLKVTGAISIVLGS